MGEFLAWQLVRLDQLMSYGRHPNFSYCAHLPSLMTESTCENGCIKLFHKAKYRTHAMFEARISTSSQ